MKTTTKFALAAAAATLIGCDTVAWLFYTPPSEEETNAVILAGFRERGSAKLDRLKQSELQAVCSKYPKGGLPKDVRQRLETAARNTINYPADGVWLGDWKRGEKIAQSGAGFTFTDAAGTTAGGNCYACHQITKEEVSYGNIGPSLYRYGKLRGKNPEVLTYTWGRIWNAHAFNACTSMPRFGDAGILTPEQIRDLMALLLDPESSANR